MYLSHHNLQQAKGFNQKKNKKYWACFWETKGALKNEIKCFQKKKTEVLYNCIHILKGKIHPEKLYTVKTLFV